MHLLQSYTSAHRYLLEVVRREAGIADPVAFQAGGYHWYLTRGATMGRSVSVDGVEVRDWTCRRGAGMSGLRLGIRLYRLEDIPFATVHFFHDTTSEQGGMDFVAVERSQYLRLYRLAVKLSRAGKIFSDPPVLAEEQARNLWKNTIGFLEGDQLKRIRAYGGRCRRGVLLTGPPGNGKTMACRWIWEECCRRNWEYRMVTPNNYQQARHSCNPEEAVRALFTVYRRGIVFFDDMDLALRDREKVNETDDQSIFLTALDGITMKEGVVYVFTTNCSLQLIDRAFKRPGRIDVVLQLDPPDADLRRRLLERWHGDIVATLNLEEAVATTDGFSFADIEELRNLLIMHFVETDEWNWRAALERFATNRDGLVRQPAMGFSPENALNGCASHTG